MPVEDFVPFSALLDTIDQIPGLPLDTLIAPLQDVDLLKDIGITAFDSSSSGSLHTESLTLAFRREFSFELSFLAGLEVVIGGSGGVTEIPLSVTLDTTNGLAFQSASLTGIVTFRFPAAWLKPMVKAADGTWGPDPTATRRELRYTGTIAVDASGGISFQGANSFSLGPSMIGDSGVIVEANDVRIVLSDADIPAGAPPGFTRGVYFNSATLSMKDKEFPVQALTVSGAFVGTGGVTANIGVDLNLAGSLGGFDFSLTHFGLDILQNSIVGSDVRGKVKVPFFEGEIDVALGIQANGDFSIAASSPTGLAHLSVAGLLAFDVNALEFGVRNGLPEIGLGGKLTLERIGGVDFPDFELRKLTINSRGEVTIDGGWIDLGDALSLDFNGFQIALTRLGFGTETATNENWIGLSGSISLSDGLSVGGNVDGLRIWWKKSGPLNPRVTVEGVGVELTIPNVLEFSGYVRFIDDPATNTKGFSGDIHLSLPSLNFTGEASLLVGRRGSDPFFYIAVSVDLPFGIPLAQTGVAFYGFQGLLGYNTAPNKTPDQHWYEDWYLKPVPGVTQASKWKPEIPAFAIGLGATLGTFPDNGFMVSGRVLIAVMIPGPVILIEGRANVLSPRSELSSNDPTKPLFRALMVLDGREGTFLMNVGANYAKEPLITIGGTMEAYFDFHDLMAWHLYLGIDEPREKRIQAKILDLIQANAYWMLTPRELRFGAWAGYQADWKFGPLKVALEAWMEGGARVGISPIQIAGFLQLHGSVRLSAFGIGLGLTVDARLDAEAPKPFRVKAHFEVALDLPWPLPDPHASVTIEWEGNVDPPEFLSDNVIKSITVEHEKTSLSWTDAGGTPRVPPDALPIVSFERPVRDAVYAFSGATLYTPEKAGNHTFSYSLTKATLTDLTTGAAATMSGVWKASVTPSGVPCSKLEIRGKSAFSYNGSSNTVYFDGFGTLLPDYPCGPNPGGQKPICTDFPGAANLGVFTTPVRFGSLVVAPGLKDAIAGGTIAIGGATREVLVVRNVKATEIRFDAPVESVTLLMRSGATCRAVGLRNGVQVDKDQNGGGSFVLKIGPEVDTVVLQGAEANLLQVCWRPAGTAQAVIDVSNYRQVTATSVTAWFSEERLFTPNHQYRLDLEVKAERSPDPDTRTYAKSLTFNVAAPPALTPPPDPSGLPSKPNPYLSLAPYVKSTVPRDGQRPVYRTYDVGVDFNENYIESLYTGDLRIELFAPGDREVTPPGGVTLVWGRQRTLSLDIVDQRWLETIDGMTCVSTTVDLGQIPTHTTVRPSVTLLLEAEMRHDVRLFASGARAFSFSFVTSRFLNFRAHLDSFTGRGFVQAIALPSAASLQPVLSPLPGSGAPAAAEGSVFDGLYFDTFGLQAANSPEVVEWTELRSPGGNHALLFASPEPLDWARITVAVTSGGAPVQTFWVRHADGSKAFVFFPSGGVIEGAIPNATLQMDFAFKRDMGAALPLLSVGGDTTAETATHVLHLPFA